MESTIERAEDTQRLKRGIDEIVKRVLVIPAEGGHVFGMSETPGNIIQSMFIGIEEDSRVVTHILLNPRDYSNLRMWDRDVIDIELETWKLRAGIMGKIWGAEIVVSKEIPVGEMVVGAFREFTGQDDVIVRWKCEYKELPKATGKAYAMSLTDQPPELPEGQQWLILKLGFALLKEQTKDGQIPINAVAKQIPLFFVVGTDRAAIRECVIERLDAMLEASKQTEGSSVC